MQASPARATRAYHTHRRMDIYYDTTAKTALIHAMVYLMYGTNS